MRWNPFAPARPVVSVVRLSGVIAQGARGTLNDAGIGPAIERAFTRGKPRAVALLVNSPGGSPVQSSLIGARIRRLADKHKVPVHAFVEDVAASGGYWLACAADDVWTDHSSITGSIGVISAGFGLHELIGRWGIERRVHTAGDTKSKLDPFKPEDPEDVARLDELLGDIHRTFIDHVKARRGAKLGDHPKLFSGEIWVGDGAREVGLTDGVAHMEPKMRELYGDDVRFRRYGQKRPFLRRFGAALADGAAGRLDALIAERTAYARFGL